MLKSGGGWGSGKEYGVVNIDSRGGHKEIAVGTGGNRI